MTKQAYLTQGGRVIYAEPKEAEKYLSTGGYKLASSDDILWDNVRKGRVPNDFHKVHFPFWDNANPIFGYGTVAYNLIKHAYKNKIALQTSAYQGQKVALIYKTIANHYKGDKTQSFLKQYYESFTDANRPKIIIYSMWETTRLPEIQAEYLEKYADVVVVPSNWLIEVLRNAGVTKPIEVMAHGTDEEFEYQDRPDPEVFQFLHYNAGELRKGYKETIKAFVEEFKKGEKVKLVLKTTNRSADLWEELNKYKDKIQCEIEVVGKIGTKQDLNKLLGESNCFVFPSKGEGFGLTPLEAIKTGLPVIITKGHAFEDFWNDACLPVKYKLEPAEYGDVYYRDPTDMGKWFQPDIKELRKQMRYAFENWQAIKKAGKKGSQYISKHFTWDKVTQDLNKIINKYV